MLSVPFVKNDGGRCGQACALMALAYFFPNKKFTFEQIDQMVGRNEGMWISPLQSAVALDQLGLEAKVFSSAGITEGRQAVIDSFKRMFGPDFGSLMSKVDLDVWERFAAIARKEGLFEIRENSCGDLKNYFDQGCLAIPKVDHNILLDGEGGFRGHFVLIVDMDDQTVTVHDPTDGPALKYPVEIFNRAYTVPGANDDVLVVYGKKK